MKHVIGNLKRFKIASKTCRNINKQMDRTIFLATELINIQMDRILLITNDKDIAKNGFIKTLIIPVE